MDPSPAGMTPGTAGPEAVGNTPRQVAKAADGAALTMKTERRARKRDRRTGWERRVLDVGSETGVERRGAERRVRDERRARR